MAVCNHCGTVNPDGVKFCSECGAPFAAAELTAAAAAAVPEIPEIPAIAPEIPAAPEVPAPEIPAQEATEPALSFDAPQPVYTPPAPSAEQPQYTYTPPQTDFTAAPRPAAYPIGGFIAWAVITMLFCWPLGLVALLNAVRINKSATEEEQRQRISRTKTWCIIATAGCVLGLLSYLGGARRAAILSQ